jgi:hypothetical protein
MNLWFQSDPPISWEKGSLADNFSVTETNDAPAEGPAAAHFSSTLGGTYALHATTRQGADPMTYVCRGYFRGLDPLANGSICLEFLDATSARVGPLVCSPPSDACGRWQVLEVESQPTGDTATESRCVIQFKKTGGEGIPGGVDVDEIKSDPY